MRGGEQLPEIPSVWVNASPLTRSRQRQGLHQPSYPHRFSSLEITHPGSPPTPPGSYPGVASGSLDEEGRRGCEVKWTPRGRPRFPPTPLRVRSRPLPSSPPPRPGPSPGRRRDYESQRAPGRGYRGEGGAGLCAGRHAGEPPPEEPELEPEP